jgi:hypothetical protein
MAVLDFGGPCAEMPAAAPPTAAQLQEEPEMDNLIARVAAAASTTPETARQAVALILDFLKREAPEDAVHTLMTKAPALGAIAATAHGTGGEGMGGMLKGLMGTGSGAMGGGGLMALGSDLMHLGLGMDQIQATGKEVFAYARAAAGDDVVGEISAAIPGIAQFI